MTANRALSGLARGVLTWAAVLALGAGLDLAAARLGGYPLRAARSTLLLAHAALWAVYAALAPVIVSTTARLSHRPDPFQRAPRSWVLVLACAPVLARAAFGGLAGWGWVPVLSGALLWVMAAHAEKRTGRGAPAARTWGAALAAGALGLAAAAWPALPGRGQLGGRPAVESGAASAESPNVLLIVLDTVRADRLALYGCERATMPFLDGFGRGATVFERAIAPSSWTLPSHASLFTGLAPQEHGADTAIDVAGVALEQLQRGSQDEVPVAPLSEEAETLAERIAELGLHTGAICANTSYLYRAFGLAQGFGTYVDAQPIRAGRRPAALLLAHSTPLQWWWPELRRALVANEVSYLRADEVTDLALAYLEPRREQRFFMFLNYMDAHQPCSPVGSYARLFPQSGDVGPIDAASIRAHTRPVRRLVAGSLRDRYDAELRLLDDELARLFAALQGWGLLERTLVVIVGDHGEAFGEHNDVYHNNGAYEAVVHVPLLLRRPGQERGERIARFTSIVDVFPTLLTELGLPAPPGRPGAHLLSGAARGPLVTYTAPWLPLAAEQPRHYARHHWGIYREPYKLIERSDGSRELYDLRADPGELQDLAAQLPEQVQALSDSLAVYRAGLAPRFTRIDPRMDAEMIERLRGLGYLR